MIVKERENACYTDPNGASTTIAADGASGEAVQFFGVVGLTPPAAADLTTAAFIATEDSTIKADANTQTTSAKQVVTPASGGFTVQDLTIGETS